MATRDFDLQGDAPSTPPAAPAPARVPEHTTPLADNHVDDRHTSPPPARTPEHLTPLAGNHLDDRHTNPPPAQSPQPGPGTPGATPATPGAVSGKPSPAVNSLAPSESGSQAPATTAAQAHHNFHHITHPHRANPSHHRSHHHPARVTHGTSAHTHLAGHHHPPAQSPVHTPQPPLNDATQNNLQTLRELGRNGPGHNH